MLPGSHPWLLQEFLLHSSDLILAVLQILHILPDFSFYVHPVESPILVSFFPDNLPFLKSNFKTKRLD